MFRGKGSRRRSRSVCELVDDDTWLQWSMGSDRCQCIEVRRVSFFAVQPESTRALLPRPLLLRSTPPPSNRADLPHSSSRFPFFLPSSSQVGLPSPPKKRKTGSGRSDMFEIHDPDAEASSSSAAIDLSVAQLDFGEEIPEEVSGADPSTPVVWRPELIVWSLLGEFWESRS